MQHILPGRRASPDIGGIWARTARIAQGTSGSEDLDDVAVCPRIVTASRAEVLEPSDKSRRSGGTRAELTMINKTSPSLAPFARAAMQRHSWTNNRPDR
jgi:hypothetical protein